MTKAIRLLTEREIDDKESTEMKQVWKKKMTIIQMMTEMTLPPD